MATNESISPVGGVVIGGSAPVTFTSGSTDVQVDSDVQVLWDFDNDGDFSESVEDVTSYVLGMEYVSGRDYPSSLTGRAGPGKLRVTLNNDDDRFSYWNTSSPLNTSPFDLKLGRKIRVETTDQARGAASASYVGIGAAEEGDNASLTPAIPSGVEVGDLLVIVAAIRNSGTGTVDTPEGWSPIPDENGDALRSGNLLLLGRYYAAGDTAPTVTFTGGVAGATTQAQMLALRGVHARLSQVVSASDHQLNASAQNIALPGVTGNTTDLWLVVGWKQDDWTSVGTLSGQFFTEISDTPSTVGDDSGIEIQYRDPIIGSFTGTSLTVTGGASAISRGMVVAFAPAVDEADPVLLAKDRFNRMDKANLGVDELGNTWTVQGSSGGYGIEDNTAAAIVDDTSSYYATHILETVDVSSPDHYVQVALPLQVQDGRVGVCARFVDSSNYVRAYYDETLFGIVVEEVVGGTATNLFGASTAWGMHPFEGMVLGLQVINSEVKVFLSGAEIPLGPIYLSADVTGTGCGLYGYWETHSDVPPTFDEFYVWDKVAGELDGCLWTGTVTDIRTTVEAGALKAVQVDAEGPLRQAGMTDIAAPRIWRRTGEVAGGLADRSPMAGTIVGDCMARAGLLHPPEPLANYGVSTIGSFYPDDGNALDIAREVELADRGFMRESRAGNVVYEDQHWRVDYNDPCKAWFTDTAGTGQYVYEAIEPGAQQARVVNRAIAQIASATPTVVDVDNQSDSDTPLDVVITMPEVQPLDLFLVFIVCSSDEAGYEFGSPPGWTDHRRLRQEEGNGIRIYSRVCDGTEGGDTVTFYKGGTVQGTFIAHTYHVRNWYGTDDGIKIGRISQGIDAYPVTHGWGREPTLFILFQGVIGSTGGILWGPLDAPPPIGYDYDSLEGLVWDVSPDAYETGVESIYKFDCVDEENPRSWANVFDDYLILETVCVAVRGGAGPIGVPHYETPGRARSSEGVLVQVEDIESQDDHGVIRTPPDIPRWLYTDADGVAWCEAVLAEFADDRPILRLRFTATKNDRLRTLARDLFVSDRVTVTATGNAGLGLQGDYRIEAVRHAFSNGIKHWACEFELSPAVT